ncbi:MAG: tetratricopeptide repeat protein [Bacteroidota bacterium]
MNRKGIPIFTLKVKSISSTFKACLFFLLFTTFYFFSSAQDTISPLDVEQKSLQLFQDKKWNELIPFLKNASNNGIDYFYLQMRMGIAYYEKKNYCLAESHFKKALKYSSADDLALEYLYYCYVFTGRNEAARMLIKTFNKNLSEKIGANKLSPISFIMLEYGTKISDSSYYYDNVKKTNSIFYNPAFYVQLGLNHYIKNRVSLFHALTLYNQQNFVGTLHQKQYYLKASIPLKSNWLISPAFHAINIDFSGVINVSPSIQETYTTNNNYYVGSLSVQKTIKKFIFSASYLASNISNVTQYISSGFISFAPLGNSKIVFGCTAYLNTVNSYSTTNTAFVPFVYLEPFHRISLKFSYLNNTGNNIIEDNAYLVNNSPDLTKSRIGVLANFFISKKVSLYALYQLENKKESNQYFNYKYNIILAGIKIIPSKK